jgi:lipopolysaccharide transport system permease protein
MTDTIARARTNSPPDSIGGDGELKDVPVFRHDAAQRSRRFDLGLSELFAHHELLIMLLKRDLQGIYQQSIFGLFWRMFPPLLMVGGFSLVLAILGKVWTTENQPYFMVLYTGLLIWQVFSSVVFGVTSSILSNSALIKKAYFPRLIPPLVTTADKLIDVALGTLLLAALLGLTHQPVLSAILIVPFLLWAMILGLGVGLWLAWPNVALRDVGHFLPIAMQGLFYLSPVLYPAESLPAAIRPFNHLNPMATIITSGRWAALGTGQAPGLAVVASLVLSGVLLIGGLIFFRRVETVLADTL